MNKEKILFIIGIVMIVVLLSMYSKPFFFYNKIDGLEKYDTNYTRCVKNTDGTYNLYIYASSVQFEQKGDFQLAQLRMLEVQDGYEVIGNNRKIFLPKMLDEDIIIRDSEGIISFCFINISGYEKGKIINYQNMFGDSVKAISYDNKVNNTHIVLYPTITGVFVESVSFNAKNDVQFKVNTSAQSIQNMNNGYIVLSTGKKKEAIIYEPLLQVTSEKILTSEADIECNKKEGGVELKFSTKGKNYNETCMLFSIERYVNKIPDSAIYSKKQENSYLRNYAFVGNSKEFGEGIEYLRFRVNYYLKTNEDNIISAEYHIKQLDYKRKRQKLTLYKKNRQWSSTTIEWENSHEEGVEIVDERMCNYDGWVVFDITEYIKECVNDLSWITESMGCIITSKDDYAVVASSDNSLYVPYVKITLKELPEKFMANKNINPDNGY